MRYVDGYVVPMPKRKIAAYRRLARRAGKIWMEHGALQYCECMGDDMNIKGVVSFRKLCRLKPGQTAFFSFVVFSSRRHRDRVNAKVMKDPRMAKMMPQAMAFDMKRMVYGGFKALVDL